MKEKKVSTYKQRTPKKKAVAESLASYPAKKTKPGIESIKTILAGHSNELREKYKIKEIGIFGSYIRGEQKRRSDIDILVEFDEPVSLLDLVGAEIYLSELLNIKVDLVPKRDLRPELKDRILKETVYV
ncbi:MAG: nucleotidyltransferase family protein [Nitrospirota bacterium]